MNGEHKFAELVSRYAPADEVVHLRERVAELERALSRRRATSGQIAEALQAVLAEVRRFEPPPPPKPARAQRPGSAIVHVVHLTDWHIGQRTRPEHIEEFGRFDVQIAEQRVRALLDRIVAKTRLMRAAYRVDAVHVLGTGDWVSGDIHEELIRTNELPAPAQAVRAGYMLGAFLNALAAEFPSVTADLICAGNHDRITRKPQAEDGGLNSWGYIACEIAARAVERTANCRVRLHLGSSAVVNVPGARYLITHGDGILGTWGLPWYGIERRKQREAMARMNMPEERHFDKIVLGHFHAALNHEHWLVGGSLSGTTAFDHKCGRHARAHQTSWFVHPRHGEFDWTRWWLE